jgi:hypothetical protein
MMPTKTSNLGKALSSTVVLPHISITIVLMVTALDMVMDFHNESLLVQPSPLWQATMVTSFEIGLLTPLAVNG